MKYLAVLSAILLVTLGTFVDARIGSEKIVAHREAEEIVDVVQDRSQLAHRELKVCRRGDSEFKKRGGADQKAECSKAKAATDARSSAVTMATAAATWRSASVAATTSAEKNGDVDMW
eukprot:CAMPEP_0197716160 /NCGR_PEP_ID=MMETSP1434-20131217/1150_1 /TAXON_ID=265543 /ORGANISM="Minutocellus polymorphus, Strain CCMP3303" /LENGTH=117 /DNA_ID=CAMNT_0043300477 /DNA_START=58 /DNA_END=409 /DNA_ORIENTATION=+